MGVFSNYDAESYPYLYSGTIRNIGKIAGGTPTDQKVAEAWIRSKLGDSTTEAQIISMAARAIAERGAEPEVLGDPDAKADIVSRVNALKNLNGFKRDKDGLYLEGRHLKACLKEAVSVCVASGKLDARGWGRTNKGALSFAAEHIIIPEQQLHLRRAGQPIRSADDVDQRFVSVTRHGIGKVTGIQYEEVIYPDAEFDFSVKTDFEYSERDWAMIWTTAQEQGIGASRSQSYGVFEVIRWDCVDPKKQRTSVPKPRAAKQTPAKAAPAKATTKRR